MMDSSEWEVCKMVSTFFKFLWGICLIAFFVGLIKPELVMFWAPEAKRTRKWAAVAAFLGMFVFLGLSNATMTDEQQAAHQQQVEQQKQEKQAKEQAKAEQKAAEEKAKAEKKAAEEKVAAEQKAKQEAEAKIPIEYKNALKKAEMYGNTMHMSKQAVYEQLTSEYGERFPAEAAQYAINNAKVDYKKQALEKAKSYQSDMAMSADAVYEQLTSEYGERFTPEEAQYALDNLPK